MDRRQRPKPPGLPLALGLSPRCGARTRRGTLCQSPAVAGKTRCRMHGGAAGSGAPKGKRNGKYRHGGFTTEGIDERPLVWSHNSLRAAMSGAFLFHSHRPDALPRAQPPQDPRCWPRSQGQDCWRISSTRQARSTGTATIPPMLMRHSLPCKASLSKAIKGSRRARAMHSKTIAGLKPAS
jgi:hypothetical protein